MMGPRQVDQAALFYEFSLERHVPAGHLLRSIDRFVDLSEVRSHLAHAQKRKGFDWDRWNRRWLYDTLGLFNAYRVRRDGPKVAPAG